MHSRKLIGLGTMSLAAAVLAASSRALVADPERAAPPRVKVDLPKLGGEWAAKPAHQPKKGKPTKAEKKAAKRARTRGVEGGKP